MRLRHLTFVGPQRAPACVEFKRGLNVICGASETGKSLLVETIDFMLGRANPIRDIPERAGYDRVRLAVESSEWPPLTLERSVDGGDFRAFAELLTNGTSESDVRHLKQKHGAQREDTVSFVLLERSGLVSKVVRRNAAGKTRSLSFRDIARLCVVTEEEIQGQRSPLLSGQWINETVEYSTFKLLLTGLDDSALVEAKDAVKAGEHDAGKLELLDQMIAALQIEIDDQGIVECDVDAQLERLRESIKKQNAALFSVQRALDTVLQRRSQAAQTAREQEARITEIDELLGRFSLLDEHYLTDLRRLTAIRESGSLFVHLDRSACPLCGAEPGDQHLGSSCDGNVAAVVEAATAEMEKIRRLRRELQDTVRTLSLERLALEDSSRRAIEKYRVLDERMSAIAQPVAKERGAYERLIMAQTEARLTKEKIARLGALIAMRSGLEREQSEAAGSKSANIAILASVLDDFAQTVQSLLREWRYPNTERVFFDPDTKDFQIAGKNRGSTGKGLRAITHAAVKVGLMEFCQSRDLPHPGFVVLDSPLLAYWAPEGEEDDLSGTDLKDRFYEYLKGLGEDSQVIIVENEHPPETVASESNVVVFTKNPQRGRYGFFRRRE